MDMFRFILFVIICIGFSLASCTSQNNEERNKIVFNDPVPVVEDSIKALQKLLEKLPEAEIKNYMTYQGKLTVNSEIIGNIEDGKTNLYLDTISAFQNFSERETQEFLRLVTFLKENHIESSSKEPQVGNFLFGYRKTEANRYNDLRRVMLVESKSDTLSETFASSQKILDRKGKLILVAPKDAVIYE